MASIEDDADEPAEESLISAVLHFKIGQPQATAKEIHAALASKDPVSLADVKKAASKAMKKLALGGTTAASGVAVAIGSATAVDSSSALCFMPFAPGSVVTNLDGLKCKVLKTKADGRVAVVTEQRQKLEIPHEQLVLIDTPVTPVRLAMKSSSSRRSSAESTSAMSSQRSSRSVLRHRISYFARGSPSTRWHSDVAVRSSA